MWITDAIMLHNIHKLVIATSARELRIFSISFEHCIEEFALYGIYLFIIYVSFYNLNSKGLPAIPTCLEYWYDETVRFLIKIVFNLKTKKSKLKGKQSDGCLYIGDECGNIQVFKFRNPSDALFDPIYKPVKGVEKIYLSVSFNKKKIY